jgi:sterol desaturase/sphingolipid hydroxylase (fatty acid hydroxylase superfamily)
MQTLHHLLVDVARLGVWLALLSAVFIPLERLFAVRPARWWRAETPTHIGYYFLSSLLPAALIAPPMALLATALHRTMPAAWQTWAAALPAPARWTLALVLAEVGMYWGHRWSHAWPLLWRFHATHHAPEHLDWLCNTRAHPVDMVFVRLCGLVPVYASGLLQVQDGHAQSIAFALVTTVWGFLIHANLRWRFGVLEHMVTTPAFHHWHHTRHGPLDRNYATMFPWIDRLFGTLHLPREWPADYGIDKPTPPSIWRQLVAPFRR